MRAITKVDSPERCFGALQYKSAAAAQAQPAAHRSDILLIKIFTAGFRIRSWKLPCLLTMDRACPDFVASNYNIKELKSCTAHSWNGNGAPKINAGINTGGEELTLRDVEASLRHVAGGTPKWRLKARLNAASES